MEEKCSLSKYIRQNHNLLTAFGLFVGLTIYSHSTISVGSTKNVADWISYLSLILAVIVGIELWRNANYFALLDDDDREKDTLLTAFIIGIAFLTILIFYYITTAYGSLLASSLKLGLFFGTFFSLLTFNIWNDVLKNIKKWVLLRYIVFILLPLLVFVNPQAPKFENDYLSSMVGGVFFSIMIVLLGLWFESFKIICAELRRKISVLRDLTIS